MARAGTNNVWYYAADYQPTKHGAGPTFPEGVGYLLMAAPRDGPSWGVFQCMAKVPLADHIFAIPEDLRRALSTAEHYPPALAIARDAVAAGFRDRRPSRDDLFRLYTEHLLKHMSLQPSAPYLFVEATGDEPGYLTRGQFYWVLRYLKGAGTVNWVSSDYFIYENSASDFALSEDQLSALLLPFARAV